MVFDSSNDTWKDCNINNGKYYLWNKLAYLYILRITIELNTQLLVFVTVTSLRIFIILKLLANAD